MIDLRDTRHDTPPGPSGVGPKPQQTDNGRKPGDAPVDQDAVEIEDRDGCPARKAEQAWAPPMSSAARRVTSAPSRNHPAATASHSAKTAAGAAWAGATTFLSQIGRLVTGAFDLLGRHAWAPACAQMWLNTWPPNADVGSAGSDVHQLVRQRAW